VPLENAIRLLSCASSFVRRLGVFVDEAAQDRFSVDLLRIEAGGGGAGLLVCPVRDALVDALVRPGAVVVRLVLGQDSPVRAAPHPHRRQPSIMISLTRITRIMPMSGCALSTDSADEREGPW
jgi:hypothetical protein